MPHVLANALAGIGLSLPIITIVTAFVNLFGMGGAPLCSIARGGHEEEKAKNVMGNSCSMLLITGTFLICELDMGVEGAVLAAVISQGVSAVWVLKFLTGKKAILHLTRKSMWSVIGYNYGAGCYQSLKSAIRFTAIGCIVFTTVVWAILFFEPRFFADVYTRA